MAQVQAVATDNGAGATTVAITVAATGAGRFLAVLLGPRSTVTISSVADNQSSAGWTVATLSNPDPVGGNIPAVAYCASCNPGVTTITVTLSGSAAAIAFAVERDDIQVVSPFESGLISGNGAAAVTSFSSGTSAAVSVPCVAYGWTNTGTTGLTFTAGSGWKELTGTGLTPGAGRTNATDADQSFAEVWATNTTLAATGASTSATQNTAIALFRLKPQTPISIGNSRHPGISPGDSSQSWRLRQFFRQDDTVAATGATFNDSVAESVAFADGQTAQADFVSARAESIAFTDAQTAQADFSVARAETVAFTDAQVAGTDTAAQRDESIAFTDSQTGIIAITGQVDESIGLTDSQSATATFASQRDESVAFSDAQSAQADFSAARAESIAFADAQSDTAVFVVDRAESVAFADAQTVAAVFSTQRAESVAFADAQDATLISGGTDTVNESISFGDSQDATVTPGGTETFSGGFPDFGTLRERRRKKEEPEPIEIAELPRAVVAALPPAIKRRKTVTLDQLIGAAKQADMSLIDIEVIFQAAERKKRQQDDEEILLFY